ncbi:hypothetical protein CTAYLR_006555 [Chrysophaeum taylorii]|uniref:EF-hand domain-containing protein n=1 Tax=Chrysophaeum taylorii TaxID=2483200 RepID=A0AAD7UHQ1_9STRA|nr:hypothetical protein CTAYLR_006555 [Chrysophaeum taylorii]
MGSTKTRTRRLNSNATPRRSVVLLGTPRAEKPKRRCSLCAWTCCAGRSGAELLASGEIDVLSDEFADMFALPEETNPRKLSTEDRRRLLELFGHFDRDGNNHISEHELRVGLSSLGNPPSVSEAQRMITQLDLGRGGRSDGFVDFEEFLIGLLHRRCLLYKAMYEGHKLTGKPTSADEALNSRDKEDLARLKRLDALDPRARLTAVLSAQTGRRTNLV